MKKAELERRQAKTKENQLRQILQNEFKLPPRIAQAIVEDAAHCWQGNQQIEIGQMNVILTTLDAKHGETLAKTKQTTVTWTINAGAEDDEVQKRHGGIALRRQRIQRLLSEAIEQGGVASQEDLAQALQVSVRTIKRDCALLMKQGVYLPTRGNLKGIGRGQTHKSQIVRHWLSGATIDQVARKAHHATVSVQRYVNQFLRVMQLQRRGLPVDEIALLLQIGRNLVQDYLAIYQKNQTEWVEERITQQLARIQHRTERVKKGVI